jgi:serine/threonine-protein kinase BUR1
MFGVWGKSITLRNVSFLASFLLTLWSSSCVFGEMMIGKPILAGESDAHQLELIWDLMGSPTEETMPGWKTLPGAHHIAPRIRPGVLQNRFRE